MKKVLDILLVLVLVVAVGFLVYSEMNTANLPRTTEATATVTATPTDIVVTPSHTSTPTLIPASVMVPSVTPTLTPRPTQTSTSTATDTITPTSTPTLTATVIPTDAPTQSPSQQEMTTGIQRGGKIIKAIEAYHNAQGSYPATLDALVPDYFPVIPVTVTDEIYYYRLFDPSSPMASEVYWLSFRLSYKPHAVCTYLRRLDYWDCNFNSP